jgi:hypothetical protein
MPSKGTTYKTGKRNLIIDKKFCNSLREETGLDIDDKTIRSIILDSNDEIADLVVNGEEGFKLPENLGYIVVTKYKSKRQPVDWVNSKKLRRKVLLTNLHSFGYVHHIKWFKIGATNFAFREVFRLEPARLIKRAVAKNVKSGKVYHEWSNSDFWGHSKTLKKLYKK